MNKYTVTVVAKEYYDYTIEANSMAEAISMAEEATSDMDIFESLTLVKEGRIILDDAGTLDPQGEGRLEQWGEQERSNGLDSLGLPNDPEK